MNKKTIEIPLVKATYEELQEVICELQVERYIKDKEIERLNNIIKLTKNNIDITMQIIKEQPTGNDEWILERLNGIKEVMNK